MTLWTVFTDVCLMAGLLLIGQILRANLKIFQRLLIPPSLIAGFLALAFGPGGMGLIPFSGSLGTYASVLIVLIFAAMPIGDKPAKEQMTGKAIGGMFFNITGIAVLQYGVGMLLGIYVLNRFFDLHPGFGLMMATGFYGGHGTAAAVGSTFAGLGWAEATDLAMTTATVGIVGGIIGGVAIINWGTRKGYTHYVTDPKSLPRELRTGLVDPDQQKSGGKITISSICLDPMAFHLAIVLVPSLCGYYLCQYLKTLIPAEIPAFCMALLFGFIVQGILKRTGAVKYIDRSTISRISGTSTDFLIISGVGSVKIALVVKYAVPLLVVCAAGFLITWIWFMAVGAKSSPYDWFERNMMVWGHATGVAATGVLLQRVVDPDLKSRGIEDSGISDLFNRPIIVGLQVIPPIVIAQMGMLGAGIVTWVIMGGVALMFVAAYLLKWWRPENPVKVYHPSGTADESLGVAAMQAEG
ncbi:MAG: sodium:glutamate symporter [Enterocloster asparagiformis]|nr:sodium:glutamate symporter [Enterocloster asparagiformis]